MIERLIRATVRVSENVYEVYLNAFVTDKHEILVKVPTYISGLVKEEKNDTSDKQDGLEIKLRPLNKFINDIDTVSSVMLLQSGNCYFKITEYGYLCERDLDTMLNSKLYFLKAMSRASGISEEDIDEQHKIDIEFTRKQKDNIIKQCGQWYISYKDPRWLKYVNRANNK
jgi:hypothetical protein